MRIAAASPGKHIKIEVTTPLIDPHIVQQYKTGLYGMKGVHVLTIVVSCEDQGKTLSGQNAATQHTAPPFVCPNCALLMHLPSMQLKHFNIGCVNLVNLGGPEEASIEATRQPYQVTASWFPKTSRSSQVLTGPSPAKSSPDLPRQQANVETVRRFQHGSTHNVLTQWLQSSPPPVEEHRVQLEASNAVDASSA